jgi:hypothetical protein
MTCRFGPAFTSVRGLFSPTPRNRHPVSHSAFINSSFTMPSLWLGCVTEQADQTSARKGPSAPKLRGFCFCRGGRLLPQSKGTAEINSAPQRKSPSLSLCPGLSLKCKLLPRGKRQYSDRITLLASIDVRAIHSRLRCGNARRNRGVSDVLVMCGCLHCNLWSVML